jgi:hypothetical protein
LNIGNIPLVLYVETIEFFDTANDSFVADKLLSEIERHTKVGGWLVI